MKRERVYKIVKYLLFIIFGISILFLAFKLRMGLSPDSLYHIEVSRAYSTTWGIPENTPDTYQWRDITRIPYLYFWSNARILNLNNDFINEIILLRIINVIYSLGTVFVTYLISKEILKGKWARLMPVFLLTNTLMFLFLSSSINYDNLGNLFSVLGIFFFIKFVKSKLSIKYLLLMLIALCLGSFTKYTVLPLAFILVLLTCVQIFLERKNIKGIKFGKELFLLLPLSVLLFFNIQIYGVNLIRYGGLEPNCEQILTHEQCLSNGVYYRDKVTMPAIEVNGISHIVEMIVDGERENPIVYFRYWIWNIVGKVYGIMGDNSLETTDTLKALYLFFLTIGVVISVIFRKELKRLDYYLILTFLFYVLVLFFAQNYNMYLKHNHMYLALQGRYLFPVISIGYVMYSRVLLSMKKKWLLYSILIPLILLFIYGCLPYFFLNVENHWFELNF
ncbi:MAG: DUF2142 domain-containing protein [Candidatus Dojkabacteria bacterium]|nr:DUF2142 domain-containing protein [Candidatus Dojkabacteria bacterium]